MPVGTNTKIEEDINTNKFLFNCTYKEAMEIYYSPDSNLMWAYNFRRNHNFSKRTFARMKSAMTMMSCCMMTYVPMSSFYTFEELGEPEIDKLCTPKVNTIYEFAKEQYLGREDYLIGKYFHYDYTPESQLEFELDWKDSIKISKLLPELIEQYEDFIKSKMVFEEYNIDFDKIEWEEKEKEFIHLINYASGHNKWAKVARRKFRKNNGLTNLRVK